jgi:site-specific recombinase XerD
MKIEDPSFFGFVRDFLTVYLPIHKASSAHTIKSYRETINLFLTYVCDMKHIRLKDVSMADMNAETLSKFLDWLCEVRGCTASTRNHSHMETTLVYAFADTEMKRVAIEKATEMNHPLRGQKVSFEFEKDEETLRKLLGL